MPSKIINLKAFLRSFIALSLEQTVSGVYCNINVLKPIMKRNLLKERAALERLRKEIESKRRLALI